MRKGPSATYSPKPTAVGTISLGITVACQWHWETGMSQTFGTKWSLWDMIADFAHVYAPVELYSFWFSLVEYYDES